MNKSESKYFNTALLMNEALLLLLEKKDYDFITVTDICKKAGVNRSTFYLHYEKVDDLLEETIEMINRKFNDTFHNNNIDIIKASKEDLFLVNDDYLIPYLNFIKENRKIYKLIHDNPFLFKKQITFDQLYNQIFAKILDKYGVSKEEQEYIFSFFSFGLVAILQKWIEKDCNEDVKIIAEIMKKVIKHEN